MTIGLYILAALGACLALALFVIVFVVVLVVIIAISEVLIAAVRSKQHASERRRAIDETMTCAKQIVQSYGNPNLPQDDRDNLCRAMEHYRKTAK